MPDQATAVKTAMPPTAPAAVQLVAPRVLFGHMQPLINSIALRAYELFEENGQVLGRDLEDWLQAESELLHQVRVDIAESDESLTVHAEVADFTAPELEVSVDGRQLAIAGTKVITEARPGQPIGDTEPCVDHILRVIDLPAAVEATTASALLQHGILELKLPKATPARPIPTDRPEFY